MSFKKLASASALSFLIFLLAGPLHAQDLYNCRDCRTSAEFKKTYIGMSETGSFWGHLDSVTPQGDLLVKTYVTGGPRPFAQDPDGTRFNVVRFALKNSKIVGVELACYPLPLGYPLVISWDQMFRCR